MDKEQILKIMNRIFCDVFDDDSIVINESSNVNDIKDWDSLIQITLISSIEEEFNIRFSMDAIKHMNNVGEIINLIIEQK